jgi:hypothetical protein
MRYMKYINQELDKCNWFWNDNDLLIVSNEKSRMSY